MSSKSRTLQSNVLPERTFPCEEKCEACIGVATLDDKIAALKRATAELEAERVKLLSKVNHCHDIITNRLPVELFTKILQLSLPTRDVFNNRPSRLDILGPFVFSAVSSRWREIVCSTPLLWAVVTTIYRERPFPPAMEEIMETWISRSGPSLISFVMDIDTDKPPPRFIPQILYRCSHRLEYLRLEGGLPVIKRFKSGNTNAGRNAVLMLAIIHTRTTSVSTTVKLQQGSVIGLQSEDFPSRVILSVDTSRLTHANLSWPPMVTCMDLLAWAPMMVDLSIDGIYPDASEYPRQQSPITHQALRRLRMTCKVRRIDYMLGYLTVPSLQHLDLFLETSKHNMIFPPVRDLLDGIVRCLQRSSARLEYLSFRELPFDPDDQAYSSLKTLIGAVGPSIKQLVIEAIPSTLDWNQPGATQPLIDSIFEDQKPLPFLQSITVSAVYRIWLHHLKALMISISRFVSANGVRPISLVMLFQTSPLYFEDGGSSDIDRVGTLLLPGAQIAEMLSLKEQFNVTIKILVKNYQGEKDISDRVLDVLTQISRNE